jgi:uncharacterized protein (TIGR03546 family)
MLTMIAKLLKVLNSEAEPVQISLALCFSMVAGLPPTFSLHNIVVLLIVFLLRVNLSAFFLGTAFFAGLAYLLDPLFHRIGLAVLTAGSLNGLWTALYNSTIWRIIRFNNTVVMGSFIAAIALFAPLFLFSNMLIRTYREHVLAWVRKTRVMQAFFASRLYGIYKRVSGWEA